MCTNVVFIFVYIIIEIINNEDNSGGEIGRNSKKWHYFTFNSQSSGSVGQQKYLPQVGIKSFNIWGLILLQLKSSFRALLLLRHFDVKSFKINLFFKMLKASEKCVIENAEHSHLVIMSIYGDGLF